MLEQLTFPAVMGILNVTPDSFSDGGKYLLVDQALRHVERMVREGADIIDIGGESTRPGAVAVSAEEEADRVIPVVERVKANFEIPISVDTSTPEVILAAASAGVSLINDVRALRRSGALSAAAETRLPVCLMHMQGDPETMQSNPIYRDLIGEISAFFRDRISTCTQAGMSPDQIMLDPGFGFGKTPQHNLRLINRLRDFEVLGKPLLVGVSRKSTIGKILDGKTGSDLTGYLVSGSVAGAVLAVNNGASIVRVHDVGETAAALQVYMAVINEKDDSFE